VILGNDRLENNREFLMRSSVIAACGGVLLGLLWPSMAGANIGPKWWGDRTAEPLGLKGVAITHEKRNAARRSSACCRRRRWCGSMCAWGETA
jgi:hypothetical protein